MIFYDFHRTNVYVSQRLLSWNWQQFLTASFLFINIHFFHQALGKSILDMEKGYSHKLFLTCSLCKSNWIALNFSLIWAYPPRDLSLKYGSLKSICRCPVHLGKDFDIQGGILRELTGAMILELPTSYGILEFTSLLYHSCLSDIVTSTCWLNGIFYLLTFYRYRHKVLLLSCVIVWRLLEKSILS